LPSTIKKIKSTGFDYSYCENRVVKPKFNKIKSKKKKKSKKNFFVLFFAMNLLGLYGYFVAPYVYTKYFEPLFLNRFFNKNINIVNVKEYLHPSIAYLHNSFFLDGYQLTPIASKTKEFTNIQIIRELSETKEKLLKLFENYSKLEPSVFVWEYSQSAGLEINSNESYPSASIIKIPILFELIRLIDNSQDTQNPIDLYDKREFNDFFRTSGSGNLQKTRANVNYSIDYLANEMIASSDNSATNMLLYEIGGVDGFNRYMRNIGLKETYMQNWLPDLEGENRTTTREISEILYNIDNPNYINPKYKSILKKYLGNTKNTHLIKEKLPPEAIVLHKTGDIGTMLGDSAIIYTDNGKKYIVTIMVKRPHNDYSAKLLIQEASELIYNDIKAL